MDKDIFTNNLKELMPSMSEEEIERTLNALISCKAQIYQKDNIEKSKKSRLLSTTELYEAELHYIGDKKEEGTIKTAGASLLTLQDYSSLKDKIPRVIGEWWLYNKNLVSGDSVGLYYLLMTYGKIRPVIIIEEIQGDLKPGEYFSINNERFKLLDQFLAIKATCLDDSCAYTAADYESSIIRLCVDGWYMKLINDNKIPDQGSAGEI